MTTTDAPENHIRNIDLNPAELLAILEHKRNMSGSQGREITLEEAISHFIVHFRADWLKEKNRRDNREQVLEIERHKFFRSQDEGRDIGKAQAAEEWCNKYASIWRAERESLERNGFLRIMVTITSPAGLHTQPSSTLAEMAGRYDCEVYLHRPGMNYYNFLLQSRPYINVKSVIGLLTINAVQGESLEFIATGPAAAAALEDIAAYIHSGCRIEQVPPVQPASDQ